MEAARRARLIVAEVPVIRAIEGAVRVLVVLVHVAQLVVLEVGGVVVVAGVEGDADAAGAQEVFAVEARARNSRVEAVTVANHSRVVDQGQSTSMDTERTSKAVTLEQ